VDVDRAGIDRHHHRGLEPEQGETRRLDRGMTSRARARLAAKLEQRGVQAIVDLEV
jgi:hypothetical protein